MAEKTIKGSGRPIPKVEINLEITPAQGEKLLKTLKRRFEENMDRHTGLEWSKIQAKLEAHPEKLSSLNAMERTGGEPDVVGFDQTAGEYIFMIVRHKRPRAAEIFVTTAQLRKKGKRKVCIQLGTRWISQLPWVSSF